MADAAVPSGPAGALGVPGGAPSLPDDRARHRAVLDSLDEVVFQTDATGTWTYLNRAWTAVTGFAVEDTLGRPFLEFVHPDEQGATLELFRDVVERGLSHCHHETRYRRADGSSVWVELRSSVLFDRDGVITGNAGTIIDISERRRLAAVLEEQTRVLELIARGGPLEDVLAAIAGLLARHAGGYVVVRSGAATPPGAGSGASGLDASTGSPPSAVGLPDGSSRSSRVTATRGVPRHLLTSRIEVPIRAAGRRVGTIAVHRDPPPAEGDEIHDLIARCARLAAIAISRHRAEQEVRHRAFHDHLTGLPNRALVADRLQQGLLAAGRRQRWLALVLVDLDHFKHVNDTLGHEVGDRVLRTVARRLDGAVRGSDTVCRLGGDEFVVVLTDLSHPADAERLAGELLRVLREALVLDGVPVEVAASAGVALSRGAEKDVVDLFREADVAMYRAKQEGGGCSVFDSDRDDSRLHLVALAADLQQAIGGGQLSLHYQPKVGLLDGATLGLEGLARWQHPARGAIPPSDFIPMAEATGAITALSSWVLRTALLACRGWPADGSPPTVAVNISAPLLHDAALPEVVAAALDEAGVEPHRLELEITESAVMANPDAAQAVMRRIVETGVTFAIDDFGTGYSSLAYMKRLPVRALKIDRAFIRDLVEDERDVAIVRSVIDLAHDLGMEVVAEGVESDAVRHLLGELRCDAAQGFLFARPLHAAAVAGWLAAASP